MEVVVTTGVELAVEADAGAKESKGKVVVIADCLHHVAWTEPENPPLVYMAVQDGMCLSRACQRSMRMRAACQISVMPPGMRQNSVSSTTAGEPVRIYGNNTVKSPSSV